MRNTFKLLADGIDRINAAVGRAATWCCLFVVLVEFAVVVMRYVLGVGSIAVQESVLYAQAALFMLAAAWTLQKFVRCHRDASYSVRLKVNGAPAGAMRH